MADTSLWQNLHQADHLTHWIPSVFHMAISMVTAWL